MRARIADFDTNSYTGAAHFKHAAHGLQAGATAQIYFISFQQNMSAVHIHDIVEHNLRGTQDGQISTCDGQPTPKVDNALGLDGQVARQSHVPVKEHRIGQVTANTTNGQRFQWVNAANGAKNLNHTRGGQGQPILSGVAIAVEG